jgi:hypothetical protein
VYAPPVKAGCDLLAGAHGDGNGYRNYQDRYPAR